jgi:hypothetical protein
MFFPGLNIKCFTFFICDLFTYTPFYIANDDRALMHPPDLSLKGFSPLTY